MIGCALALVGARVHLPRLAIAGGVMGLIALTLSPMTVATWPLAMISAAALIAGSHGPSDRLVGPVLTSAPIVHLGKISYGVYLWHYPVMWHLDLIEGPGVRSSRSASSRSHWLVAEASHRWIEQPLRRQG